VCKRPVDHDWAPYYAENDREHYSDDQWTVALRNGLYVDACWTCWFGWPDEHKLFSPGRFGRPEGSARVHVAYDDDGKLVEYELLPPNGYGWKSSRISHERMLELMGGP
jgi:hypothetical protein